MTALDTLHTLHIDAETIEGMGGKVTPTFARTRTRWAELRRAEHDPLDGVAEALTGTQAPDVADLAERLTLARLHMATLTNTQATAQAWQDLAARLLPGQRAEWAKTVEANYATAAEAYAQAAGALVAALDVVDPDTAPEALMDAAPEVRTAWVDVPTLAARVDEAAAFLHTAASHAEVKTDDATRLALIARVPEKIDRREFWAALDGEHGRAGRWGTLHRLGATLTPAPDPATVTGYRRPRPIETRYLRVEHGWRAVEFDPETGKPEGAVPAGATAMG